MDGWSVGYCEVGENGVEGLIQSSHLNVSAWKCVSGVEREENDEIGWFWVFE